jgi:hypothetical protein
MNVLSQGGLSSIGLLAINWVTFNWFLKYLPSLRQVILDELLSLIYCKWSNGSKERSSCVHRKWAMSEATCVYFDFHFRPTAKESRICRYFKHVEMFHQWVHSFRRFNLNRNVYNFMLMWPAFIDLHNIDKVELFPIVNKNFMMIFFLWVITPCNPFKVDGHFGWTAPLATCLTLVSCLVYSSTQKAEATSSSETSVDFQRTTRCYIPDYRIVHDHRCKNLES